MVYKIRNNNVRWSIEHKKTYETIVKVDTPNFDTLILKVSERPVNKTSLNNTQLKKNKIKKVTLRTHTHTHTYLSKGSR